MTEILGAAYNGMLLLFLLAVVAALLRSPLVNMNLFAANGTTQIDHVVVSRYAILVFETKNMKWLDLRHRKRCHLNAEPLRPQVPLPEVSASKLPARQCSQGNFLRFS